MIKKTLLAAAALTALSGSAFAQSSSVTLYGIMDINVAQSKAFDGSTVTGMNVYSPTNPRGSRFGMRGSEDLGGGMRGVFQIEGGISPENGTTTSNNQLFNRHAWVGITAGWGELLFGRQETIHRVVNNGGYGDVSTEGELSVTTANSGLQMMQNFGTRTNNAVRYVSPTFNGVRVRVQSALGQRTTASTNGIAVTYDQGPLKVALSHEYYDGDGIGGPISRWNQVTTLNGRYNFGPATLALGYQQTEKLLASSAAPTTSLLPTATAYNVGVIVPVTSALNLLAQYTTSTTKTPANGTVAAYSQDYSRIGLSARYSLSPRTFMYASYTEKEVDYAPTATAAAIATLKSGNNKNSLGLGISHAF